LTSNPAGRDYSPMTTYDLYLESGPKKKKTMVHAIDLLGCVATGPSTEDALAATPAAIAQFHRFLHRHGDAIDLDAPIETRVVAHITEGQWLGNGSPYMILETDYAHLSDDETERYVARLEWMSDELAAWAETQTDAELDAKSEGRTARAILLHLIGAEGAFLSAALSGAPGFGKIHGAAERGELPLSIAIQESAALYRERIAITTPEQRNAVRELASRKYTLRKALRRTLEHHWEHLAELSRRPGGPEC
jgi:predicted RNase H-like HicB family nuclease